MELEIDGIRVEVYPNVKENGNAPLYILLHGLGMNSLSSPIKEIKEYLLENKYYVATLDFLGQGRSSGNTLDITISSQVEQVKIVLGYLRLKNTFSSINIIAHSQGAVVASLLAKEMKIDKLILLAPAFTLYKQVLRGNCLGFSIDFYDRKRVYNLWGMKLSKNYFKDILRCRMNHSLDNYQGKLYVIISSSDEIVNKDELIQCLKEFRITYSFVYVENTNHEFKNKEYQVVKMIDKILSPLE